MLNLSRKANERILIGKDVTVTVTLIDRNRVRLSIDAPADVPVWRAEVAPKEFLLDRTTDS